jgi:solute carrier family 25 carnitine/acylcarnitine transporter 20/29
MAEPADELTTTLALFWQASGQAEKGEFRPLRRDTPTTWAAMDSSWDIFKDLVAGSIGGAAGCVIGHPIDVVKARMQIMPATPAAALPGASGSAASTPPPAPARFPSVHTAAAMLRDEGVRSFWRGLQAPLWGVAGYQAVVFSAYNFSLGHLQRLEPFRSSETAAVLAAGVFAGAASTLVTTPCDLVKIQMQLQTESAAAARYRSSPHCAAEILRAAGPRGLFRGLGITLWRDAPTSALYFLVYEQCKTFFLTLQKGGARGERQQRQNAPGRADVASPGPGAPELMAGGIAGTVTWALASPVDVIKTNVQADPNPSARPRITAVVRGIVQEHGWAGFKRGLGPITARAFPVNAVTFWSYEHLKIAFGLEHLGVERS